MRLLGLLLAVMVTVLLPHDAHSEVVRVAYPSANGQSN